MRIFCQEEAITPLRSRAVLQIVLLNLRLFKECPLSQGTGRILPSQEFPLGDRIVQQFCIVEAAPFAGEQTGHYCNAACGVRRGWVAMVDGAICIENPFILRARSVVLRHRLQAAFDCGRASKICFALAVRRGSMHRGRAKQDNREA